MSTARHSPCPLPPHIPSDSSSTSSVTKKKTPLSLKTLSFSLSCLRSTSSSASTTIVRQTVVQTAHRDEDIHLRRELTTLSYAWKLARRHGNRPGPRVLNVVNYKPGNNDHPLLNCTMYIHATRTSNINASLLDFSKRLPVRKLQNVCPIISWTPTWKSIV